MRAISQLELNPRLLCRRPTGHWLLPLILVLLASATSAAQGPIPHSGWAVTYADSQETICGNGQAGNAIDGNTSTIWHTQLCNTTAPLPHEIQIDLGASYVLSAFQYLPRQDGSSCAWIGQYQFYVSADGSNWGTPVASGNFDYTGYTIKCPGPGAGVPTARQIGFSATIGRYVRLRALSEINGNAWTSAAEINVIGTANVPPVTVAQVVLNPATVLGGSSSSATVTLTAAAPAGGAIVTVSSSNPSVAALPASITVAAGARSGEFLINASLVSTSTAVAINTSYAGITQTATLTITPGALIQQSGWMVVYADSQETSCANGQASNAIDGNSATMWHTQLCNGSAPPPHEIQIDLGTTYTLSAFQYLTRQDGSSCGWINQYEFYVSPDGINWGSPVAAGTFDYTGFTIKCPGPGAGVPTPRQIGFPAATGRHIRLRALSEVNGNPWTSAAEINVLSIQLAPLALTFNPTSVAGGSSSTGTVALAAPAPAGGVVVSLTSTQPALAKVPASIAIPEGNDSADFQVSTSVVNAPTPVDIFASLGGVSQGSTLILGPLGLISHSKWSVILADSQQNGPGAMTVTSNVPESPVYSIARGYQAANLIDGNTRSLAYPGSSHLDYQISLGQLTQLSSALITWGQYGTNPIYVNGWSLLARSAAGQPWVTLAQGGFPNSATTQANLNYAATDLRVVADSANWIGIYELQLSGTSVVYSDVTQVGTGQITVKSNVTESPVYSIARGYQASNLIDGNPKSLAYPGSNHLDYQISLGQLTPLASALITWGQYGSNPIYVTSWLLLGRSGASQPWVTLAQGGFPNSTTTLVNLNSSATDVRIVADSTNWIGIYELDLKGIPPGCVKGAATNAIDGNSNTMWVTQYCGGAAALPHEIQIDLGAFYNLSAFQYLPRQDGCASGWISQYEFYVSSDGANWGAPVASGTFDYTGYPIACPGAGVPPPRQVGFAPTVARYIRLRALSEVSGNPWTAMAEINVLGDLLPSLFLSPASIDFPDQRLNTPSSAVPIVLTNVGLSTVAITGLGTYGDFVQTNNCGVSLAALSSCTINVTFTPRILGYRSAVLTVLNSATGQLYVPLSGNGVIPVVSLSSSTATFGLQLLNTTGAAPSIDLSNKGTGQLVVSNVTVTGDFSQTSDCVNGVAPGSLCTIQLFFTPTAVGTRNGSLTIFDNSASGSHSISLSGTGVNKHTVSLSWTASTSPVMGYFVYRATQSGGPYTELNPTPQLQTAYTDSLPGGATFYYVVTAVDANMVESVVPPELVATIPAP